MSSISDGDTVIVVVFIGVRGTSPRVSLVYISCAYKVVVAFIVYRRLTSVVVMSV